MMRTLRSEATSVSPAEFCDENTGQSRRPPIGTSVADKETAEAVVLARASGVRAARKAITRDRILTAARALFADRPYAQATLREVSRMSGVSIGGLHGHFSDKADLWRAAMECEPPLDSDLVRASGRLLDMLRSLHAARLADSTEAADRRSAWRQAEAVMALFDGDGELEQGS